MGRLRPRGPLVSRIGRLWRFANECRPPDQALSVTLTVKGSPTRDTGAASSAPDPGDRRRGGGPGPGPGPAGVTGPSVRTVGGIAYAGLNASCFLTVVTLGGKPNATTKEMRSNDQCDLGASLKEVRKGNAADMPFIYPRAVSEESKAFPINSYSATCPELYQQFMEVEITGSGIKVGRRTYSALQRQM